MALQALTGNTKFDPNTELPDLSGKTFVVTGGSAGIGFGIVAHLLQHHAAKIYLLSNKEDHQEEAIEELKKYGDVSKVELVKCNLGDLHETDRVAQELKGRLEHLNALICNAGVGVGKYELSKDGLDSHMQINHLSQFHLTRILLPTLVDTPDSRLVFQSSDLHRGAKSTSFNTQADLIDDIGPAFLYNRTKLANLVIAKAFARRVQPGGRYNSSVDQFSGPWTNATHPGAVHTGQQSQAEEAYGSVAAVAIKAIKPFFKSPVEEGCRPALWAATHVDVMKESVHGMYVVPDRKVDEPSKQAMDEALGENLWKLSEEVLAEKLGKLPYEREFG